MSHFTRVAYGLDMGPLLIQLAAAPDLWNRNRLRTTAPGTAHGEVSDIWVRYNDPDSDPTAGLETLCGPHIPVWHPAWYRLPALHPIVFNLAHHVRSEMIGGILITRLPPEGRIGRHADSGWHVDYYDKYYLAVNNAPGAVFYCEADGTIEGNDPANGEIHHFDNRKPHWVHNQSDEDRIVCIVCLRTPKPEMPL